MKATPVITNDPAEVWGPRLRSALGDRVSFAHIQRVCPAKEVLDDTAKLGLYSAEGRCLAVAHCSSKAAPEMAEQFASRAETARAAIEPRLGSAIMTPMAVGKADGLSYCVYPYHRPLREGRVGRWLDRRKMCGPALRWLFEINAKTAHAPCADSSVPLDAALVSMAKLSGLSEAFHARIDKLRDQLSAGDWRPRRVLQHGDFWYGNLLHASPGDHDWPFVVIDWPGSRVDGVPVFDLVRFAMSLGLDAKSMGRQLNQHAEVLGCSPQDTSGHLLTALAELSQDLHHFPVERFVEMANQSVAKLAQGLAAVGHGDFARPA